MTAFPPNQEGRHIARVEYPSLTFRDSAFRVCLLPPTLNILKRPQAAQSGTPPFVEGVVPHAGSMP